MRSTSLSSHVADTRPAYTGLWVRVPAFACDSCLIAVYLGLLIVVVPWVTWPAA